ncbi:MAG: hypothetical protein AB7U98_00130 [Candidatus Nitrosocosmicus sp.]
MDRRKENSVFFALFVGTLIVMVCNSTFAWNLSVIQVYGHSFTPNSLASFISAADQFQTEVNLIKNSLINNNNTNMAQKHADEANSIFYWELMSEIAERDKQVSAELKSEIDSLRDISTSLTDSNINSTSEISDAKYDQLLQQTNLLVSKINVNVNSILNTTISQKGTEDPNPFNQVLSFLSNVFAGQESNTPQSIQSMRFVELLDEVLRNYGDAYAVNYDMTDMSNMANMNRSSDMMMDHGMTGMDMNGNNEDIINLSNYQSAKGLTERLEEIFVNEIKPLMESNEMSIYSNNIEKGLTQLQHSIENKAPPMDVMMVVHSQIHPSLIEAFDLQIT